MSQYIFNGFANHNIYTTVKNYDTSSVVSLWIIFLKNKIC